MSEPSTSTPTSTSNSGATVRAPAAVAMPRFDYYQTDTAVTVSIFVKSASTETLSVDIGEHSLHVRATSSLNRSEYILHIDPLFSSVDTTSSSYKVLGTKIDVILHKAQPRVRWLQLSATRTATITSATTPSYAASQATPTPTAIAGSSAPRRSKWDSFNPDAAAGQGQEGEGEKGAGEDGEADINQFFQKLYADADEDTKRAMMKSYMESGGTTLSTDWSKVGKATVDPHPPQGMEAKKW